MTDLRSVSFPSRGLPLNPLGDRTQLSVRIPSLSVWLIDPPHPQSSKFHSYPSGWLDVMSCRARMHARSASCRGDGTRSGLVQRLPLGCFPTNYALGISSLLWPEPCSVLSPRGCYPLTPCPWTDLPRAKCSCVSIPELRRCLFHLPHSLASSHADFETVR